MPRIAGKSSPTSHGTGSKIGGTAMKAFEIHTYRGGKWKIDSIFDDRELAIFEAQRMDCSNRFPGLRVVEEIFDEAASKTTTRTIFRGGAGVGAETPRPPPKKATARDRPAVRAGAGKRAKSRGRRPAKKKSGIAGPLITFFVVVLLGAATIFGLQYIPGFP